jgi:hypothetical protein
VAAKIEEKKMVSAYTTEAALQAYRRLIQLNMESWKPEVSDWLRSEEAEPVLEELLVIVPCSGTVH